MWNVPSVPQTTRCRRSTPSTSSRARLHAGEARRIPEHGQRVIGEPVVRRPRRAGRNGVTDSGLPSTPDDQVDQVTTQLEHHAAGILGQLPALGGATTLLITAWTSNGSPSQPREPAPAAAARRPGCIGTCSPSGRKAASSAAAASSRRNCGSDVPAGLSRWTACRRRRTPPPPRASRATRVSTSTASRPGVASSCSRVIQVTPWKAGCVSARDPERGIRLDDADNLVIGRRPVHRKLARVPMPDPDLADAEAPQAGTGRGLLGRKVRGQAPQQRTGTRTLEKRPSYEHESPPFAMAGRCMEESRAAGVSYQPDAPARVPGHFPRGRIGLA